MYRKKIINKKFSYLFRKIGNRINSFAECIYPDEVETKTKVVELTEYELALANWNSAKGDKTLRLTYDLNPNSIVFDLGGYEGQWASDIFSKYQSNVFVFEPVSTFYSFIRERFSQNPKIKVFNYGLGSKNQKHEISINADCSSMYYQFGKEKEIIKIVCAKDFIDNEFVKRIDLLKINIEGGEYDLLEHLIKTELIQKIDNIQVQFHNFPKNADIRMRTIQKAISKTHHLTYHYHLVWENWCVNKIL